MEGVVVRRVIPSDNSCLFNAVGYVMEHNKSKASELRQVIAAAVASDPEKYNEAFLGKPNEAYCAWILDPDKWGGAIELSILSEYYGREIAAYDIQTTRCDLYGQGKNYNERAMLIYDGLHYDALAMSPAEGAPEEFDQTIYVVDQNRSIGPVEGLALNLAKEAHRYEEELHRHRKLYIALRRVPNWCHWSKGSCGTRASHRPCQFPRIQMTVEDILVLLLPLLLYTHLLQLFSSSA